MNQNERNMWKIFQRFGRIKNIFISNILNIKRQRFDFVIQEVVDAMFEKRLGLGS